MTKTLARAKNTENSVTRSTTPGALRTVPVGDILASPDNTRRFDPADADEAASIEELAASIAAQGLQQPPKVRPSEAGSPAPWTLIYGERRLCAVRDVLKRTHITVLVDEDATRTTAVAATVVENLQRRDLHPMDEARGLALLRAQGLSTKAVAARVGRREAWVKERLMLCALPAEVQDIYRRSARMTVQQALALHEYTRGGRENTGFPALLVALTTELDSGRITAPDGASTLAALAATHPTLVRTIQHGFNGGAGWWSGHYFNTRDVCRRCPFAAYRPGYYDGVGYCLVPDHYAELSRRGKESYEAKQAEAERECGADSGVAPTDRTGPVGDPLGGLAPEKTPAQKGKETRKRHAAQKAAYDPAVQAITRLVDQIANVDGIDVAALCAYTLTTPHVSDDAVRQVIRRHGLARFPAVETTPGTAQIEALRTLDPVEMVRYTLEALLLTQAMRARDYDPGKTRAEPVLALYVPGQVAGSESAA